jgi:hypothetical protein
VPDRPDVVVLVDPATRSAVVRVTGPLEHGTAEVVRRVVRRAVTVAGPWVTVDLAGCTGLAVSVAECLVDEHERLRAWGGALVCEGLPPTLPAPPASGGDAAEPPDLPDEELVVLLRRALLRRLHADEEPERTAAGRRLLVLLREQERRGGSWPPRPADARPEGPGSTWNTDAPSLVEDRHEHP